MLTLDKHIARIVMDMHQDRVRMQMGDPVPTRRRAVRLRKGRVSRLRDWARAAYADIECGLADVGASFQERGRFGAWLSGFLEPRRECG